MKAIDSGLKTFTTAIFIFTLAVAAQAQNRVFVSGLGDDTNPCTRTLPCRNFQRGHDAVVAGGEVVALDSAGYGQLTITKSVTITGEGVYAGITAASGSGVTIDNAGITVTLRSIAIEGLGTGTVGIDVTDFNVLHIENCIVNGFSLLGMRAEPPGLGTRKVFIKDSSFKNNVQVGIFLNNFSGTALVATIEGTRTENNGAGVSVRAAGTTVTARRCLSSGNASVGFTSSVAAQLNIESSVISSNGSAGIQTDATVRVSNSVVTNNAGAGFMNIGGTFESRGNNTVAGNNGVGAQTIGTITPIAGT